METNKRRVISLLVDNQSGVLARVSSLFCRRGFNIDSLTVSATNDPAVSRITVTITSDEKALSQLILQTERLEVTRQVFVLDHENSLERELLLLKVASDVHNRSELREIASIYKAKIIDLSPDSMVFELIGRPDKLDAFLKMFEGYNILEQCRTGVTALERGGMHQHMQKPPQEVRAVQLPLPGTHCPGCGTQHPQRFACVVLAAAPTATPCFRHWRRSSLLLLPRRGLGISENFISSPEAPIGRGAVERMRD